MNTKNWDKQISRYRVIEHQLRDKSVFIVEWNDKWFFGIWGKWHQKFHSLSLEEAIKKIHRLVKIKN
tara:strand:- start:484 stop:684 length:201 start_codon:yes stop_codon:yes gene_type:complete